MTEVAYLPYEITNDAGRCAIMKEARKLRTKMEKLLIEGGKNKGAFIPSGIEVLAMDDAMIELLVKYRSLANKSENDSAQLAERMAGVKSEFIQGLSSQIAKVIADKLSKSHEEGRGVPCVTVRSEEVTTVLPKGKGGDDSTRILMRKWTPPKRE